MPVDKTRIRQTLKDCLDILNGECSISIMMASKVGNKPAPNIFKILVSDELAATFNSTATKIIADLHQKIATSAVDLQNYDPGTAPADHEVEVFEGTGEDTPSKIVKSLEQIEDLPPYQYGKRGYLKFTFYVISFKSADGRSGYLFRKYSPSKQLSKSGKILTFLRDNVFDKIDSPIFQFDAAADCICIDDTFLINDQRSFHSIFNYFDEAIKTSEENFQKISSSISIDNIDAFKADCKRNPLLMLKLRSIAKRDIPDAINMDDIEKIIEDFGLPVAISGTGKERQIQYTTDVKWHVLKLLEDSYGYSARQRRKIEAVSKRYMED